MRAMQRSQAGTSPFLELPLSRYRFACAYFKWMSETEGASERTSNQKWPTDSEQASLIKCILGRHP